MENPANKTIHAIQFLILGMILGFIPGLIRVDQMRQAAEDTESFQLRTIAELKRQIHDQENYYLQEMAFYRHAAGARLRIPTPAEASNGLTCAEEFYAGTGTGTVASGLRSWKPREDGRCYAEDGWR